MIVRINQFDASRAAALAGWSDRNGFAALDDYWPRDTHAFEVLILDSDERHQALDPAFRRQQLRQLIPELQPAFTSPGERLIARFDGPILDGALREILELHSQRPWDGLAISPIKQIDDAHGQALGSIRIGLAIDRLATLCERPALDPAGQRMRIFAVRDPWARRILQIDRADDPGWPDVLANVGCMLETSRGLQSLQLLTRWIGPAEARERLLERLRSP
jgi:hypothetical protein